ncbi:LemA family protein [Paractinoplanes globisporus]|uniref:LemA family protein n=1 Tax=Paractinoplanes globisporus TaxID=113565 RepID=A0ABW6WCF1_9ACTN|nr:LemA family protein [Actinoplanes globisporus]
MTTVTAVAGGIVCALLIVFVAVLAATYNRLVRLRNQADASWSQIDVQLKRRYDLVPNLVETVRGYAAHERGTLDAVVAARGNAMAAAQGANLAGRAEAEGELTAALGRLFAVAEAYPDLKANHSFVALQAELANTEDKIAYARQFFTSAVQSYNNAVQTLPTNIVAALTGFRTREYYQAAGDERGPVQVRF